MPNQNNSEQMSPEREAFQKYGTAVKDLNDEIEKFEGEARKLGSETGKLTGHVGKLITDTKKKASVNAGTYTNNSIVKKAAKNIFEFPVFVSSSVPVEYATATNSLLEQVYASFVQMAISQNPVVSAADVRSGNPFRQLKTNVSKYLEYTDMFYAHDACHNVITTDDAVCEFDMVSLPDADYRVIQECLDYRPLSEFDHFFLEATDYSAKIDKLDEQIDKLEEERDKLTKKQDSLKDTLKRQPDGSPAHKNIQKRIDEHEEKIKRIKEQIGDARAEYRRLRDAKRDDDNAKARRAQSANDDREYNLRKNKDARDEKLANDELGMTDYSYKDKDGNTVTKRTSRAQRDEIRAEKRDAREDASEERAKEKAEREKELHPLEKAKLKSDMKAKAPQLMDETKINKLNSMKPLMMTVGVRVMDGGNISDVMDYVIGVKTHCRMIPAEVLPDFAEYPTKTMSFVSRKAKWRAGELKLMDYLFSRKEKKQAAYDSRDSSRKWYHRLYTLAHSKGSSKVAREVTGSKNSDGLIPNVTVILTKADVDMIEGTNGIDLLKGSTAAKVCRELFLISMVVIDTDAQSIKILLPDMSSEYEVHSLASVNKQLATLDTSSDVSREVSKMMRGR